MSNYFVGIDIGSSSVKIAVFDADTGRTIGSVTYPDKEQPISAPHPGWAEQNPEMWWENFTQGFRLLVQKFSVDTSRIEALGISYQMHGLVLVDQSGDVLRPSIIWCDSRAVDIGEQAFADMGEERCLQRLLNSPGNFTASKLAWVKQNEPEVYSRIHKFMLPGDYLVFRLTGSITTTTGGLSEGVFWDYQEMSPSTHVMDHFGFDASLVPELVDAIGMQGTVKSSVAANLGLRPGVQVTYRCGDQPNNAFSLGALHPGDVAATAGTSGVIYFVTDQPFADRLGRVNTFVHVNSSPEEPRNGVLVCVNGTGILYSWLRKLVSVGGDMNYTELNRLAASAPAGSDGLMWFPFGNGAERILGNRSVGSSLTHMDFNRHSASSLVRAGMEGIVYALRYGLDIVREGGMSVSKISAGHANMFLSPTFRAIFSNVTNTSVSIYSTDGAEGAARGAALGAGFHSTAEEALASLEIVERVEPDSSQVDVYEAAYEEWRGELELAGAPRSR